MKKCNYKKADNYSIRMHWGLMVARSSLALLELFSRHQIFEVICASKKTWLFLFRAGVCWVRWQPFWFCQAPFFIHSLRETVTPQPLTPVSLSASLSPRPANSWIEFPLFLSYMCLFFYSLYSSYSGMACVIHHRNRHNRTTQAKLELRKQNQIKSLIQSLCA